MFETIAIPVWAVWLAGLLAVAGLLDRILMPSVRWYLQRRVNTAIDKLNSKLQLGIQPFKLTKRRVMVDRLANDPKTMDAVLEHSREENIPHRLAADEAYRYANEIVPGFSAFAYFGFGIRFTRWLSRALYRVRLGYIDEEALKNIDPDATVIFVMNHRSNMDYIIVTYLAASRSALSYAVGEWARIFPLKQLIRSMGGYFIRRKSRNQLYRRVLARYVQMATEAGVTQAVFPEGGLSRDGELKPAKLGLLSYIVAGFDPKGKRDVLFIPVGVNYDRVMEDRVLLASTKKEKAGLLLKCWVFIHFITRHFWLRITGKFYRFGYASVGFGRPYSLREYINNHDYGDTDTLTGNLGEDLMEKVGEVIPVLPVALISTVLLHGSRAPRSLEQITRESQEELDSLVAAGAYMHIPRENFEYAVEVGLRMLILRRALELQDGCYHFNDDQEELIRYYANSISHLRHGKAVMQNPQVTEVPTSSISTAKTEIQTEE